MAEAGQDKAGLYEITTLTAEIVGAYVGHHSMSAADLPDLIALVGKELAGLGQEPAEPEPEKPKPAVPIRRSIRGDEIICLVCGQSQRLLKRHLATQHGLGPEAYRSMFGLKDDYPLVAPSYAARRSDLAKKIGLGRKLEPQKTSRGPAKRATKPASKRSKA